MPIREAVDLVRTARTILLTTHVDPDPDGIGSEMALAECFEARGQTVAILNPGPTPRQCHFLDPTGRVAVHDPARAAPPADLVVVLDTNVWGQLGAVGEVVRGRGGKCLVIDHHLTGEAVGDVALVDPGAPCTGLLALGVMDGLGWPMTPRAAEALFAALVFDTGWLRFSNAQAPAFEMAARLVRAGVVPHEVHLALEARSPAGIVRLTGLALAGLEVACGGTLAVMTVTAAMLAETGVSPGDVTNLVNQGYAVEGVHSAALFVEQPGGGVKVSLRSRGAVDVSALARRYGGGGHARAAGARFEEPLTVVRPRVVEDFSEAIRAASAPPSLG